MASKNIAFDTLPSSIRVPGTYAEFNTKLAVRNLPVNRQRMIIIAQKLEAGTQPALQPVQVFSDVEAAARFGAGSMAHLMVRQAIVNNPYVDLSVIALDDADGGVAASGFVTLAGAATGQGLATVVIGGVVYRVAVMAGDTQAAVTARLVAVINADADCAVVASMPDQSLKLTNKHKGTLGNETVLSATVTAAGLTASVSGFTSGVINPDISAALDVISGVHYHIVASPYSDDDSARKLSDHVELVSNSIEQRGTIAVLGWRFSLAWGTTLAGKLNSGRVVVGWLKGVAQSNGFIAAGLAAVLAAEEDPARPLNTLRVKGLTPPAAQEVPTFTEFNTALYNGLTPLEVVNHRVQIMRAISTYTKNATGTDDPSLLDITTIRTLDYVRMAVNQRLSLRFPREKLSEKTPPRVRSEVMDVLHKMQDLEFVEQVEQNKDKLIVERDAQDVNRLNLAIPADVVNGLHVVASRIDLYL